MDPPSIAVRGVPNPDSSGRQTTDATDPFPSTPSAALSLITFTTDERMFERAPLLPIS